MYNKPNEECFVIIKRPCQRREEHCSYPQEIRFENNERFYDDNWQNSYYQNSNNYFDWNDNHFERKPHHNQCCKCNCHKEEEQRPKRRCCCFNFFRWC